MNNIGLPGLVLMLVMAAVIVVPYWKIWSRTGHSGWLSLLMLVPILNVVMIYVLAFKSWPAFEGTQGGPIRTG